MISSLRNNSKFGSIIISWHPFFRYFLIVALSIIAILLGYIFCLLVAEHLVSFGKKQGFNNATGVIGDTIGGTLGTVIAIIAAFLTFLAFWIQYEANQQQKLDLQFERFENKFFELLKLHKDNVNEMVIDGYDISTSKTTSFSRSSGEEVLETKEESTGREISGRKVFVTIYYELKACYEICDHRLRFETIPNRNLYLTKMSYRLVFNGIGSNIITNIDKNIPGDKEFVETCKAALYSARTQHVKSNGQDNIYTMPGSNIQVNLFFKYKPFSGHASRFGHYYRHLYYIVKYVVGQSQNIMDIGQKKEYLKMLRAQLSNHEQLMLYFNYLSGYGSNWENDQNKFFSDFRMIHNLPIELTDFAVNARLHFQKEIERIEKEKGEKMFEYDE